MLYCFKKATNIEHVFHEWNDSMVNFPIRGVNIENRVRKLSFNPLHKNMDIISYTNVAFAISAVSEVKKNHWKINENFNLLNDIFHYKIVHGNKTLEIIEIPRKRILIGVLMLHTYKNIEPPVNTKIALNSIKIKMISIQN